MRMLRGGRSGRVSYPVSLGSHKKDKLIRRILDTWNLERPRISEWWMLKMLSVASKHIHVSKKHVPTGCKRDLFCRQTFEVWSRRLLSTWFFFLFFFHSLNPFNETPELKQAAVSQKPDKESLTPPPPLNPAFLTPPPTVETPSQQGPKRKRRWIQFVNYLDDNKAHAKQLRKRQHKKFKPYKYSMGEEDED